MLVKDYIPKQSELLSKDQIKSINLMILAGREDAEIGFSIIEDLRPDRHDLLDIAYDDNIRGYAFGEMLHYFGRFYDPGWEKKDKYE